MAVEASAVRTAASDRALAVVTAASGTGAGSRTNGMRDGPRALLVNEFEVGKARKLGLRQ
jgi:hypothetical protein